MAGAGYKLFNTGDVLTAAQVNTYLMEQTVMVFADAAARTAALSGVVSEGMISYLKDTNAVEVYNGSAWVASDDPNAIQNTIVDAKGDLISASAADTPARLAVGNNGETLVADSSTSTGLNYTNSFSQAAAKNFIINGNYDIWQRGTSFANPANYMVDRWTTNGAGGSITFSQQTTGAPNGSRYILRATSTAGSSYYDVCQYIETANAALLWGQTVTASIKLRRNATLNNSGMNLVIAKSATVDAGSGATWTTLGSAGATLAQLPTGTTSADWYTLKVTFTVPNDGTANSLRFNVQYNGVAQNGSVVEYSQAQLELGSTVTTFSRAGGTLAGELAACQRYYWRQSGESYNAYGTGISRSTTTGAIYIPFPVTMRVKPTSVEYSNLQLTDLESYGLAVTALTLATGEWGTQMARVNVTNDTGATAFRTAFLRNGNNTAGYLGFSAEL